MLNLWNWIGINLVELEEIEIRSEVFTVSNGVLLFSYLYFAVLSAIINTIPN